MMKRQAFTLIELLVVISIITLLIAILLPALQRARAVTQTTLCSSNLRQISLANNVYVDMFKGYFPPRTLNDPDHVAAGLANMWMGPIYRMTDADLLPTSSDEPAPVLNGTSHTPITIKHCPTLVPTRPERYEASVVNNYSHYVTDEEVVGIGINGSWTERSFRIDDIRHPSDIFISADARVRLDNNNDGNADDPRVLNQVIGNYENNNLPGTSITGPDYGLSFPEWVAGGVVLREFRHSGGSNFAFLDGHAEHRKFDKSVGSDPYYSIQQVAPVGTSQRVGGYGWYKLNHFQSHDP